MTRIAMLSMHTSPFDRLGIGDSGGMNVYVRELSGELARWGNEVDVYTIGSGERGDIIDLRSGLRVHHVDVGRPPIAKDDLVSVTGHFAKAVSERIAQRGGADVIHAHYWLSGGAGHALKHDLYLPLVSTFHTLGRVKREAGITSDPLHRADAEAAVMGCSDAIVASSEIERSELHRLYDVDASRMHIVTPGVDRRLFTAGDRWTARRRLRLPTTRPLLLFAGRISRIKGLHWAVETLARVRAARPDTLLLIAGGPSGVDGDATLAAIRRQVDEEGLTANVRFLGAQSRDEMPSYYQAADLCLMPSYSESFGLVALEAAACGTPVVASRVGGLQSVIDDGRTGHLVGRGDVEQFAERAVHLLDHPGEAATMGAKATRWAERFTWSNSARQMQDIYGRVIAGSDAPPLVCLSA